jgi:hypothetical protein
MTTTEIELTYTLNRNADGSWTAMILTGLLRGHKIAAPTIDRVCELAEEFLAMADKLDRQARAYAPQAYEG